MKVPPQPDFDDLVTQFLCSLFDADDRVVLCCLHPDGGWSNTPHVRDNAIAWLKANRHANLYLRASAHDNRTGYAERNCTQTRAFFVDIDYGEVGHSRPCPFRTLDDVVGYLLTCPIRPSIAWHTGHGVQAAYLLREPYRFANGALQRYREVGRRLSKMVMADCTFTAEHAYRVPMTLNHKPNTEPVWGHLLWCQPQHLHTVEAIESACHQYGIEDLLRDTDVPSVSTDDSEGVTVAYSDLPADIRDDIEGCGERSERMFALIGRMIRDGYSDHTIQTAIAQGADFVDKYGSRSGGLAGQVRTCIEKIRSGRYVYTGSVAPPIRTYNVPISVRLAECAAEPALDAMLDRYASVAGIAWLPRVRDAARFHEHLLATHRSGVIESPCGAGKSVWALSHIALRADPRNRYLYVTETVDALYEAAALLERLTDQPVGRLHGFNAHRCTELCGQTHTWRQCITGDHRSVCRTCQARDRCAYHDRPRQIIRPILCLTHSGLIRAMEDGSALLDDANVVIDESLSPFSTWQVAVRDLVRLQRLIADVGISRLFPHTSMAARSDLLQWGIADHADVFARRQYVYADEPTMAALRAVYDALRPQLGSGLRAGRWADRERARETLTELLGFFRPNQYGDTAYAYHESRQDDEWIISVKRSRFDLQTRRRYRRLWMLNASAELAPYPYPDDMAVYRCPDLPHSGQLVSLHCIRANPTKTRQEEIGRVANVTLRLGAHLRRHRRILVAADKHSTTIDQVVGQIQSVCGDASILTLRRGTIKGVNVAGDCTLAYLGSMATFTGLDDCALHACLHYRRTFPDHPYVYSEHGSPNWPGGRMLLPAMRTYYALRSLDEIYQTIWRTAVRNDRPVEAIVVLPDEYWIVTLWRTVMPGLHIESAYRERQGSELVETNGRVQSFSWEFEQDAHLFGLRLIEMPAGQEIAKRQVAEELGYTGDRAWDRNKPSIMALLDPFFEDGQTNRMLRRKAEPRGGNGNDDG